MKKYSLLEFNNGTRFMIIENDTKTVTNYNKLPKYVRFDVFNFFRAKRLLIIGEKSYFNGKTIYSLCERVNEDGGVITYVKSSDLNKIIEKAFELTIDR